MQDFGKLVDFVRGELEPSAAASVRARLQEDAAYFDQFQRLKRTYAVLRSFPGMTADHATPAREDFIVAVRREFEARDWLSLLPLVDGSESFMRGLRTEFTVRGIVASIPRLEPSVSFVRALRAAFCTRALPELTVRPEWVRALRVEFRTRATAASLPMLEPSPALAAAASRVAAATLPMVPVRDEFRRRLQVALFETAQQQPAAPVLPQVQPADPFRRRLFKRILLSSRRRVRETPRRVDAREYQWGRELGRGLQQSRKSMAVTLSVHALAIAIMLFVFARPAIVGEEVVTIGLGSGRANVGAELPGERSIDDHGITGSEDGALTQAETWSPAGEEPVLTTHDEIPNPEHDLAPIEDDAPAESSLGVEFDSPEARREGVPSFFRLRTGPRDEKISYLGREDLFDVLDRALRYLQMHQHPDGYWWVVDVDPREIYRDPDLREIQRIELTSAALLAYLGDGHSSRYSPIGYNANVRRGLEWLVSAQRDNGQIGPSGNDNVYVHAMATLVLAEEYGLTRSNAIRTPLRKACAWLSGVRARGSDGFPFKLGGEASLTTSVWAYMALKTAVNVNVPPADVPRQRVDDFMRWFEMAPRTTNILQDQEEVLAGDMLPTAAGAALCLFARDPNAAYELDSRFAGYVARVGRELPDLSQAGRDNADARYLFFGSLAMALHHQQGGERATGWNNALANTLIEHQRDDQHRGGYKPNDTYGALFGNVYATAFAALSIENAYRVNLLTRE